MTIVSTPPRAQDADHDVVWSKHFDHTHSVAAIAREHCTRTHHLSALELLGGVACASCWEKAIRADERIVVEFDLPREMDTDPTYVDWVAVDRACCGWEVPLTHTEQVEVERRMNNRHDHALALDSAAA